MDEKGNEKYQEYLNDILGQIIKVKEKDGLERIKRDGKYNFKGPDGNPISDIWFDKVYDFHDGFARVEKDGRTNYIDTFGNLLSEKVWFDRGNDFSCGYALVRMGDDSKTTIYNYIGPDGILIRKTWFEEAYDFSDGYGLVKYDGKYFFIRDGGWPINNEEYDEATPFRNGFARVKLGDEWSHIGTNGDPINPDAKFKRVGDFSNGFALVAKMFPAKKGKVEKYNYIDTKGNLIGDMWFKDAYTFQNGFAQVKSDSGEGIINTEGELVTGKWYLFCQIKDQCAVVETMLKGVHNTFKCIDLRDGHTLCEWKDDLMLFHAVTPNFIFFTRLGQFPNICICTNKFLGDYQVKKTSLGYLCTSPTDSFKLRLEPIKILDKDNIICFNARDKYNPIVWYNRKDKTKKNIQNMDTVYFDEYFYHADGEHYFTYNGLCINITGYYNTHLLDKEIEEIVPDVNLLSYDRFFMLNESEIKKMLDEENRKHAEEKAKERKEKEYQKLQEAKKQNEENEAKIAEELTNAQNRLTESVKVINRLEKTKGIIVRIDADDEDFFITVGDHREIKQLYIDVIGLRHIKLESKSFDNVKIAGIDFRGCNINLNPQEVYPQNRPDLRKCDFRGVYISPLTNFTNVDIRGAKFSSNNKFKTLDFINSFFSSAIYDETTLYDEIPLTELIKRDNEEEKHSKI